jgi:hypothetical protein
LGVNNRGWQVRGPTLGRRVGAKSVSVAGGKARSSTNSGGRGLYGVSTGLRIDSATVGGVGRSHKSEKGLERQDGGQRRLIREGERLGRLCVSHRQAAAETSHAPAVARKREKGRERVRNSRPGVRLHVGMRRTTEYRSDVRALRWASVWQSRWRRARRAQFVSKSAARQGTGWKCLEMRGQCESNTLRVGHNWPCWPQWAHLPWLVVSTQSSSFMEVKTDSRRVARHTGCSL